MSRSKLLKLYRTIRNVRQKQHSFDRRFTNCSIREKRCMHEYRRPEYQTSGWHDSGVSLALFIEFVEPTYPFNISVCRSAGQKRLINRFSSGQKSTDRIRDVMSGVSVALFTAVGRFSITSSFNTIPRFVYLARNVLEGVVGFNG